MTERPVTRATQDSAGNIVAVGNPGHPWSPRSPHEVIRDIEGRIHTYYVPWKSGRTEIRVVSGSKGKYLRTDRDNTTRNNLDELPAV